VPSRPPSPLTAYASELVGASTSKAQKVLNEVLIPRRVKLEVQSKVGFREH
jgi:hypothetical protein